jgi:NADP-dependent 3-hydroxy acid dehydrogenase YdfG
MASANGRKSIFITGAASGIGAETARFFSEKGWFCGLYDVNTAGLADVASELGPAIPFMRSWMCGIATTGLWA